MGIVKERKGFILFLQALFENGEPAQDLDTTFSSDEFHRLGTSEKSCLRDFAKNVDCLEKAHPTSGKVSENKVKTENVATNINTKTVEEKAPQKEQDREIGD